MGIFFSAVVGQMKAKVWLMVVDNVVWSLCEMGRRQVREKTKTVRYEDIEVKQVL